MSQELNAVLTQLTGLISKWGNFQYDSAENVLMKKRPTLQQAHDTMRFFRRGGSLRMLLDDDVTQPLNTLYRYATQLMEVKEFAGAARLFQLLTIYDARSFDYWFRLGNAAGLKNIGGSDIRLWTRGTN